MEDKPAVCENLCKALKDTDRYNDILDIEYLKQSDEAIIKFPCTEVVVDAKGSSALAMIYDIMEQIKKV